VQIIGVFVIFFKCQEYDQGDHDADAGDAEPGIVALAQRVDVLLAEIGKIGERGAHLLVGDALKFGKFFHLQSALQELVSHTGDPGVVRESISSHQPVSESRGRVGSKKRADINAHVIDVKRGIVQFFISLAFVKVS